MAQPKRPNTIALIADADRLADAIDSVLYATQPSEPVDRLLARPLAAIRFALNVLVETGDVQRSAHATLTRDLDELLKQHARTFARIDVVCRTALDGVERDAVGPDKV